MIQFLRPVNLLIIVVTQLLVVFFFIDVSDAVFDLLVSVRVMFLCVLTAISGNTINDFFDWEIDGLNKKRKWKGEKQTLLWLYFYNIVIIFCLIGFTGFPLAGFIISNVLLLFLYSYKLKGVPLLGNLLVSYLSSSVIFVLFFEYEKYSFSIFVFVAFSFISTLFRELVKDVEDMYGDGSKGLHTLPLVIGVKQTKIVLFFVIIVWFIIPFLFLSLQFSQPLLITTVLNTIMCVTITVKLYSSHSSSQFHQLSGFVKLAMIGGIATMIFY